MTPSKSVTIDEQALEAAARAWRDHHDDADKPVDPYWLESAETAITAYLTAMAEKGERMMPREPRTEIDAGLNVGSLTKVWQRIWDAHAGSHP